MEAQRESFAIEKYVSPFEITGWVTDEGLGLLPGYYERAVKNMIAERLKSTPVSDIDVKHNH